MEMEYGVSIPFWNQKCLAPPETASRKLTSNGLRKASALRSQLTEILSKLERTKILHQEAAVLSRLVYRMKKVFRQDKGFKFIQMLLKTLKNHLSLNVTQVFTMLRDGCYEHSCPTKQMLEWGLVTLMRFSALFHRSHCLAEKAASILKERFSSGHHWKLAALCISVISRLWALADYFVVKSCEWFTKLKDYLPIVIETEEQWLPDDFTLVTDLAGWLGNPSYLSASPSESKEYSEISNPGRPVAKSKNETQPDKSSHKPTKPSPSQLGDALKKFNAMEINEDLGEAVVREAPEKGLKRKDIGKEKLNPKKKRKKV